MSSESSDDLPLDARGYSPNPSGSEEGSPVPEWLSAHKVTPVPIELSSSDDDDAAFDEDDSDAGQQKQRHKPARGRQKTTSVKARKGKQSAAEPAAHGDADSVPASAAADERDTAEPADGATQNGFKPSSAAKKKQKSAPKPPGLLAAVAGNSGSLDQVIGKELPLMLPEKMPRNKALVELEPRPGGATDLAGDAGAVGRFMVVANASGKDEVSIDLKGVVYTVAVVPCATTLCVVNIGANEAKVECMLRSFVRLREQPGFSADDAGGADLFADDEDNYQMGPTPDAAAEKKAAGKKAKGAGAKLKGLGGALKARGGVTKAEAGKPRAKGPAKPRKPTARKPAKGKG